MIFALFPAAAASGQFSIDTIKNLLTSQPPYSTYAGSEDTAAQTSAQNNNTASENMTQALTAAKTYFNIDDKIYTQFNYNYYDAKDPKYSRWQFTWNSDDYQKRISMTVSTDGKIFYYDRYDYTANNSIVFAKISKSDAQKTSDALLTNLLGNEYKNYRLLSSSIAYPSDRYILNYIYSKNGYDFGQYQINVGVDKITGDILNFYVNSNYYTSDSDFSFQDAAKIISKDDAVKSYLDNFGLDLKYASYFDYSTKKLTVKPVYSIKSNNDNAYISAADGKLTKITYADPYVYAGDDVSTSYNSAAGLGAVEATAAAPMADKAAGQTVTFSAAETAQLDKLKNYITSDKAVSILVNVLGLSQDDIKNLKQSVNLSKDYINQNQYIWNIYLYYDSASAADGQTGSYNGQIDARNGNIINYSRYSYIPYKYGASQDTTPDYMYTYGEAKNMVTEQIKKILPYDLDSNFEFVDTPQITPVYNALNGDVNADKQSSYYFSFVRKVNGLQFPSNTVYVNFDNITGKITSYSLIWYEDAVFPKLDSIVSPETALNTIIGYSDFVVKYMSNGFNAAKKVNVSLVYDFKDSYLQCVDALTGKYINSWDFTEITKPENTAAHNYQDLKGHWSEQTVNTLTNNGIYVWGGDKFEPDKAITKNELINYLNFYSNSYSYYGSYAVPALFKSPETSSAADDSGKTLTREEAAQIICQYLGYDELGKNYSIFKYPFNTDPNYSDEQYRGYITIINSFGLFSGIPNMMPADSNIYNAKAPFTRAEAASIVYNMITKLMAGK